MTIVETASGRIRGTGPGGVLAFTGIPYAEPPVGPLRFRSPRPPRSWTGVRDAVGFGHVAVQQNGLDLTGPPAMSEDCLVLHVWTPAADDGRRPVMVWLHGGGYAKGAGHDPTSDGAVLARDQDVVVVSLNHRLGPFGFLRLGTVDEDRFLDAENVGMLDIVSALTWVRSNIGRFGGDPDNVTLFGMSGGGWKISVLLAMPLARGLFHKAIIQSGSELYATPPDAAADATRYLLDRLGVRAGRLEMVQEVPPERVVEAFVERYDENRVGGRFLPDRTWWWDLVFAPTVDGRVLPRDPFSPDAPPESTGVPLLIGTTRNELAGDVHEGITLRFFRELPGRFEDAVDRAESLGLDARTAASAAEVLRARRPSASPADIFNDLLSGSLFFLTAVRQLEAKLALGADPVYSYLFATGPGGDDDLALHAGDVPYVFGNLTGFADGEDARLLSSRMRAAWAGFARSGNPGHAGLPDWPRYDLTDRATMVLASDCRVENDPGGDLRRILDTRTPQS